MCAVTMTLPAGNCEDRMVHSVELTYSSILSFLEAVLVMDRSNAVSKE